MKNNIYSQKSFEQHDIYAKGVDNTAGAVYNVRSSKVAERVFVDSCDSSDRKRQHNRIRNERA